MAETPLNATIDQDLVAQYIERGVAPGCQVSLGCRDKDVSIAVGRFSLDSSEIVSTDTPYDIASVTKLFTAARILQLHEAGAISLDDPCSRYLENFNDSQVRIIDLLTHRADFRIYLAEYRDKFPDAKSLESALLRISPPFENSQEVYYGNLGYVYLGKIIEQQTGDDLRTNMRALFDDLGLGHTYSGPEIVERSVCTPPTEIVDDTEIMGVTHDETARILGGLAGNAGVFSTAEDLVKFGRAWLGDAIVRAPALRATVFSNHNLSGTKPQGVGWWMRYTSPDGERTIPGAFAHNGYTGSFLVMNPENERVAALTCNRTYYGRGNVVQRQLWRLLTHWVQVGE